MAHYWKFQDYETLKGGCVRSKNKFKTQKKSKLRWLATDRNLNCYTLGVLSLMIKIERELTVKCFNGYSIHTSAQSMYSYGEKYDM